MKNNKKNMNEAYLLEEQNFIIKFDKLKILLKKNWVYISPKTEWTTEISSRNNYGKHIYKKKNGAYKLDITWDDNPHNIYPVTIEFTGKILLDDYPKLISKSTIIDCLQRINHEGIIHIKNFKQVIQEALVCQADVTKDVRYSGYGSLTEFITLAMQNNHYTLQNLPNGNIIINKNVGTKSLRQRLTIYDKGREMARAANDAFHVRTSNKLRHTFDGATRIELNLTTPNQIRNIFQINPGCPIYLHQLLNFQGNILLTIFDRILVDIPNYVPTNNIQDLRVQAILMLCKNDLNLVRQMLKKAYKPGTNITSKMVEYTKYLSQKKFQGCFSKQNFLDLFVA